MENYSGVIKRETGELTPAGGQGEAKADKSKADDHIPSPNVWDWIAGVAYIVDNDPDQANKKASEHCRGEPLWALLRKWRVMGDLIRNVDRILLAALGLRHKQKVHQY